MVRGATATHPAVGFGAGAGAGPGVWIGGLALVWFRVRVSTFQHTPRQYLEENAHLIEAILQNQNLGRLKECVHYQQQLQQNLIFLATHADDHPELRPLIFAPSSVAAPPERPAAEDGDVAGVEASEEASPPDAPRPAEPAAADANSLEGLLEARGKRRARPP
jgi:hypothetical protein